MRIKCSLHYRSGFKEDVYMDYYGLLDDFRLEYSYALYDAAIFEMQFYDINPQGEYEAYFAQKMLHPPHITPATIKKSTTSYGFFKPCECGAEKVKQSGKHSRWCPKY